MFGGDYFHRFSGGDEGFGPDDKPENVDNKKLYEVLEVEPKATQEQIKANFRRLVKMHHPDKGGDANKFKEINAANEVLSDPEKRKIYDQYGLEGLSNSGASGMNDIFDIFFGGGRRRGGPQEKPKLKPKVHKVQLDLDDIFFGKKVAFTVTRTRICLDCNGKGGSKVEKCSACKGKGAVIKMAQVGPGMYTQAQVKCEDCQGAGEIIDKDSQCKACKGKKTFEKSEEIEVDVPAGSPQAHQILVPEKGDEHYIYRTGDLVVLVEIKPHPVFKRVKNDLFITQKISLIEALTGVKFNLKRFDTEITVSSPANQTVGNRDVKLVKKMGMPYFENHKEFGDLLIEFFVEMPAKLPPTSIELLKSALPPKILPPAHPTKLNCEFVDGTSRLNHGDEQEGEEEQDEESERGFQSGENVRCQQQ